MLFVIKTVCVWDTRMYVSNTRTFLNLNTENVKNYEEYYKITSSDQVKTKLNFTDNIASSLNIQLENASLGN